MSWSELFSLERRRAQQEGRPPAPQRVWGSLVEIFKNSRFPAKEKPVDLKAPKPSVKS